jgi:chromosome segregation ATPase
LSRQLDDVIVNRDLFRQTLTEHISKSQKNELIQQIDQWERDSIKQIQKIAEEARQVVFKHTTEHIRELETKLNKLTEQLRQSREENDFFETDLCRWNDELARLTQELAKPSNINIRQDATPLITKIGVDIISSKFDASPTGIEVNNNFAKKFSTFIVILLIIVFIEKTS